MQEGENQVCLGRGIYISRARLGTAHRGGGLTGSLRLTHVLQSVFSSLCKEKMKNGKLLFSQGVIVALTGDISIGQVLLPARLLCTLMCGLLLSAVMGQPRWTYAWP